MTTDHVLIISWREAYEAAHGQKPRFRLSYSRGWFTMSNSFGMQTKHRAKDIADMTAAMATKNTPETTS